MKQGSIASPYLFTLFINDLLYSLKSIDEGVRISDFHVNNAVYVDDINPMSTTVNWLQRLKDACFE